MVNWAIVIAVVLFLALVGFFIFLIFWVQVRSTQTDPSLVLTPLQSPVGMLYRCTGGYTCDSPYQCDSIEGVCKLSNNQPCTLASQCLNGGLCSGICTVGPPAIVSLNPNDPCPCPDNMTCSPISLGALARVCKLNAEQVCTVDDQCLSNQCDNGVCTPGTANGTRCTTNPNCQSGNCSLGWCQPVDPVTGDDIVTGEIGAVCTNTGLPACDAGNACINNICGLPQSGLGASCDVSTACSEPTQCRTIADSSRCGPNSVSCYCQYEFVETIPGVFNPDPNGCQENVCGPNYVCSNTNICLGDTDQPCVTFTNCQTNTCNPGGGIYQASFTYFDLENEITTSSTSPSNIFGSFTVEWDLVSPAILNLNVQRLLVNYPVVLGVPIETLYYFVVGDSMNPFTTGIINTDGTNFRPGFVSTSGGQFTMLDAVLFGNGLGIILYQQLTLGILSTVLYNLDGTPFNPTTGTGPPGTQYAGGVQLTMVSVDRSTAGDVLILDNTTTVYVKQVTSSQFVKALDTTTEATITGVTLPRFYPDILTETGFLPYQNIGFVSPVSGFGNTLEFTGNLTGSIYPVLNINRTAGPPGPADLFNVVDYSAYSAPPDPLDPANDPGGIAAGSFIIIATDTNTSETFVFFTPASGNQSVPAYIDGTSRVVASLTSFYLYHGSSCA